MSATVDTELKEALASARAGHALPRAVYCDPAVYEAEVRSIFLRSWLCVGHASQVPKTGDYFLFEIAGESVIVIRSGPATISALLNVCRHRGSRICDAATGHEARLVCRYHGWTYALDGSLRAAAHMGADFAREFLPRGRAAGGDDPGRDPAGRSEKNGYGLRRLAVEILHGLVFVNFADDPPPFASIADDLREPLAPYGLEHARVALRRNYPIAANWKLTIENYCECYHCAPAHPEYSVAHGRAVPAEQFAADLQRVMARAPEVGLTQHVLRRSWLAAGALGTDRGFERYPLLHGHVTGSRDGAAVAPLLGTIRGYDGGATDLHLGPATFGLAYCDHVVLYRFTPRAARQTDCELTWLVNGAAEPDRDYSLEALTWLWDVTTVADKAIIERNQAGVDSRFYEPGPLSHMEDFTRRFMEWYVATMRAAL
jgi:Rieske 2Fe-2S family protein